MTAEWLSARSQLTEHLDQARGELAAGLTAAARGLPDTRRPAAGLGEATAEPLREVALARRAIDHLSAYLTAAGQACDDIADAVSCPPDRNGEPVTIGAAAQPWHDVVLLRRLCVLADGVGTDAQRRIDTTIRAFDAVRDRLLAREAAAGAGVEGPSERAVVAGQDALTDQLVKDRAAVGEARTHAQAAVRLADALARDLGRTPSRPGERDTRPRPARSRPLEPVAAARVAP